MAWVLYRNGPGGLRGSPNAQGSPLAILRQWPGNPQAIRIRSAIGNPVTCNNHSSNNCSLPR
ncbi:hypothetical protein A4H97_27585 [Niastella yeongjuensis]|uniref:Uncharacterized protein n=1 Tax=Niastella yeongjuensis TaxID=354355 RepID=A0A1V9EYV1_9BACT|nr:hypothetical protein A4H97_27585 [Niastella yeongjuensis]